MRQGNKRQHGGHGGQQDRARALDRRFNHRLERLEALLLVMIDLTDQDQRIAHQNAGKGDQADQRVDAKRLIENQQHGHYANQPQRRG